MEVWQNNAYVTVLVGGIAFMVLFLPYVVWAYRRFGQLSLRRLLGWAAVCVYFTGLAVYTLVPFPEDPQAFCADTHVGYNLHPFQFVSDITSQTAGMGLRTALTSTVVLQVVFNVVLFLPLGVLLHRYFRRGIIVTTLLGALISILIEITQLTGFFGVLPCAYRVADVDDVITNTLGTLIGALIAPLLLFWMPASRTLRSTRLEARPVTAWRRWIGMAVDGFLFSVIGGGTAICVLVVGRLLAWWPIEAQPEWIRPAGSLLALLMVFVIPSLTGRGGSLGERVAWLAPRWPVTDGEPGGDTHPGEEPGREPTSADRLDRGSVPRRLVRSLIVMGPSVLAQLVALAVTGTVINLLDAAASLAIAAAVIMVPFTRGHRSLSGVLTGAEFVDVRAGAALREQ